MTMPAAEALWQDYAFLTYELAKFAGRQNWDMVMNLLDQRAGLQQRIDALADRVFVECATSPAAIPARSGCADWTDSPANP